MHVIYVHELNAIKIVFDIIFLWIILNIPCPSNINNIIAESVLVAKKYPGDDMVILLNEMFELVCTVNDCRNLRVVYFLSRIPINQYCDNRENFFGYH